MAFQRPLDLTRRGIPQLDGLVHKSRRDLLTVQRERYDIDQLATAVLIAIFSKDGRGCPFLLK